MGTTVANFQAAGYCAVEIIKLKSSLNGVVGGWQDNLSKRFGRLRRPLGLEGSRRWRTWKISSGLMKIRAMRASFVGANGGSDKSIFGRADTEAKKMLNMLLLSYSDWRALWMFWNNLAH